MNQKPSNQNLQLEAQQETLLNTPIIEPVPLWRSKRFLLALFMAVCHLNTVFSRFNISIAIVEMTYPKIIETKNSTVTQSPEFSWDSATVGSTLSIFYYGGFVAFLVSFMVSRIGGATSCSLTMMVSGIITILHPISLQHSFFLFLVCRFIVGISESLLLISVSEVHSQWTPQNEKSKLISISTSGINIGVAIVHGVCAFLAHTWGWRMIFYVTGSISLITSLLCSIFVKNRPSDDKRISKQELSYIQERIALSSKKEVMHPYRNIITSLAVWALLSGKFAVTFGVSFITTFLPMYIKDTTQSDINKVGLISSIPNVLNIFMLPICGILLDYGKSINISVTLMVIHPYRMIFTSAAVWALLVGKFIHGWITSVLNVYFPIYVEDLTHTTTDEVGLISSIPTVVYIFMFPIAGTMMDYWKTHSHLTMTQIHKIIMSFTLITAGILFVAIAIISNFTVSMVMFVIIQILMSFVILILELVTVNLAPNDTSIIAGLSTFSAAFSSIISRTIIGFIITEHTLHEWNDCFILTAFVLISGAVIFVKYGSSEAQPWSLEVFSDAGYSSFDSQETKKYFR